MRFPDSERVIYKQNPLVEVICQARFHRLLILESETPAAFQKEIMGSYPVCDEHVPAVQLPPGVAQLVGLASEAIGQRSFDFLSADRKWKVSLTGHFVALTAADYSRWEEFGSRMSTILDVLQKIYGVSTFTRLGLRYQDIVQRSKLGLVGHPWSELLHAGLAGELCFASLEKDVKLIAKELVVGLDFDDANVRLLHGFVQVQGSDETCYLIDADFFRDTETELSDARAMLDRFNREAGKLFRWAIADVLHAAMGPEGVA